MARAKTFNGEPTRRAIAGQRTVIVTVMGPAAIHGVHWYPSHPPIAGLAYEMDMRGVRRELRLGR